MHDNGARRNIGSVGRREKAAHRGIGSCRIIVLYDGGGTWLAGIAVATDGPYSTHHGRFSGKTGGMACGLFCAAERPCIIRLHFIGETTASAMRVSWAGPELFGRLPEELGLLSAIKHISSVLDAGERAESMPVRSVL